MEDVDGLLNRLEFESREAYDRAKREAEFIRKAEGAMDLTDGKTALKLYNKLVKERSFSSIVGFEFMFELRDTIIESGVAKADSLAPIPVRETRWRTAPSRWRGTGACMRGSGSSRRSSRSVFSSV